MEKMMVVDNQDLERLEGIIQANIGGFYTVGHALAEIKDRELYKIKKGGGYQTFEAYCRGEWDMSKIHAYRLMGSSKVVDALKSNQLVTPATESQCRALACLPAAQQIEA